jgi:23S rRNA maturation-related 3'-5' exoribonuclease YhaM
MVTEEYLKRHNITSINMISETNLPSSINILFKNGHRIRFPFLNVNDIELLDNEIVEYIREYESKLRREKIEKIMDNLNGI